MGPLHAQLYLVSKWLCCFLLLPVMLQILVGSSLCDWILSGLRSRLALHHGMSWYCALVTECSEN